MDISRFDRISRFLASRGTRRQVTLAGAGLTALSTIQALAQNATPEATQVDPHPSADTSSQPELLFAQPFTSGSWTPREGRDGTYILTLRGASANTVYFSDRPERLFGLVPTVPFLDNLGFSPDNPPNAALIADRSDSDHQEVLLVELLNPIYDGGTITYDARILGDYDDRGLAPAAREQMDYTLPETFAGGSLFIDSFGGCGTTDGICYQEVDGERVVVGPFDIPLCQKDVIECAECNSDGKSDYYGSRCADAYPDQCTYGWETIDGQSELVWNCYALGNGD